MNTIRFGLRPFFNEALNDFFETRTIDTANVYKPAANISEDDKKYVIELAIPGFTKEEIQISYEKGNLVVQACKEEKVSDADDKKKDKQKENAERVYSCNEFAYKMKYERAFMLPEIVNEEKISAKYNNGILELTLPKHEVKALEAKQIAIE
ncbi:MAG: Hsp20/alpha crystallin family protein [Lentimicrobiaceae bacterium]|nr:Hsp20/alpha crystallin family protein [Lentimicrobiaceae bacterium]